MKAIPRMPVHLKTMQVNVSMPDVVECTGIICITDAVMAELEKLGTKYKVALRAAKDTRYMSIRKAKSLSQYILMHCTTVIQRGVCAPQVRTPSGYDKRKLCG